VSGWQIQALKAAHLTQLGIPGVDGALDGAPSTSTACAAQRWLWLSRAGRSLQSYSV
jgi:hypothetical protein